MLNDSEKIINALQKLNEKIIRKKFPQVKGGILGGTAGYDPAAVNLFLQDVLEELSQIEKMSETLHEQIETRSDMETMEIAQPQEQIPYETDEAAEVIKERIERLETLERSYKRMIYMAEQEAKEVKKDAQQQAAKILREAQQKAENLVKEANARFDDKQREYEMLTQRAEEVRQKLKSVAEYIENAV